MGYGRTMFLVMTAVLLFDGTADGRLNAFDHWHDHLAGCWFYLDNLYGLRPSIPAKNMSIAVYSSYSSHGMGNRLDERSWPNQSLEPTATAATSAVEQPLVSAAVVAQLQCWKNPPDGPL
jgi:hypothetical protein